MNKNKKTRGSPAKQASQTRAKSPGKSGKGSKAGGQDGEGGDSWVQSTARKWAPILKAVILVLIGLMAFLVRIWARTCLLHKGNSSLSRSLRRRCGGRFRGD